jgi:hypothetical protein
MQAALHRNAANVGTGLAKLRELQDEVALSRA